jgi:hypothetical protein
LDAGHLTLATAAARTAATTTAATRATTTTTAIVVIRIRGRTACAHGLPYRNWSTIDTIEVRFGFLIEFLASLFVEVVTALNKDCALI